MNNEVRYVQVDLNDEGQRLDNYLIRILKGVPKSLIYRIIREGQVRVNKKRSQPSTRLMVHDSVRIPPIRVSQSVSVKVDAPIAQLMKDATIYEDERLLVLNKPAGMAVHGGSGVSLGVIEALRRTRPDLPYIELVHRLDKETSGCLLLAKKKSVLREIQSLFEDKTIQKTYCALLHGAWKGKTVKYVDVPLSKQVLVSGERIVRANLDGKPSKTRFVLIKNYEHCCLVEASPKTGRTHQIRVHSASLEQPIIGDQKYNLNHLVKPAGLPSKLYLHAYAIRFTLNHQSFHFMAPLDLNFIKALNQLEGEGNHFDVGLLVKTTGKTDEL
jgi:23S rRNA pseudouridine955/2504/2580 synthase